jgi:hypothetical protein
MRTKEEWLDFHQFSGVGQALRQLMDHVEFGEDNDGQIVIYTNLTFEMPDGEKILDMDTLMPV